MTLEAFCTKTGMSIPIERMHIESKKGSVADLVIRCECGENHIISIPIKEFGIARDEQIKKASHMKLP